jgi:predicted kinase
VGFTLATVATVEAIPTLVLVHGPPGAGKSTLASAVAAELDLPIFDRDEFKDLMFEVLGWSDRHWSSRVGTASWRLLGLCVDRLIEAGVSLIAESNFRPESAMAVELRLLRDSDRARVVEVHCTADPEVLWERFEKRRLVGDRHPGHVGFEDHDTFIADLKERPHGPLDLGGLTIEVDTTNGWPDARQVASQIRSWVRTA